MENESKNTDVVQTTPEVETLEVNTEPTQSVQEPVQPEPVQEPVQSTQPVQEVAQPTEPVQQPVPTTTSNKGNIKKLIPFIIVAVLVLVALCIFILPRMFASSKTIVKSEADAVFSYLRTSLDESKKEVLDFDLNKNSLGVSGVLTVSSDYKTNEIDLNKLKNYKITYESVIDHKNNQASGKVALAKGSSDIVMANTYINGKLAFINLGDLYNKSLTTELEEEIKDLDLAKNKNIDDIKKILDKTQEVFNENLEDKDITKSKEGKLTKVEYKLDTNKLSKKVAQAYYDDEEIVKILANLTADKKENVKRKLKEHIDSIEDYESILTIDVYLGGLLNKLRRIELVTQDASLDINVDKNNYIYKMTNNGTEEFNGKFNAKDKVFTLKNENVSLKINNKKTTTVDFNYKENKQSMNINAVIDNKVSSKKQDLNVKLDFAYNMDSEKIKATITNNMTLEKNKSVEKIEDNNTIDANSLSDDDVSAIMNKLYEKLEVVMKDIIPSGSTSFRQLL